MRRKILYSPGFGAGWTSWNNYPIEMAKFLLTYQPIIDFLEAGGKFECNCKNHPIMVELRAECLRRFEVEPYLGGARQLKVVEVDGLVRIEEYDGSESVHTFDGYNDWM